MPTFDGKGETTGLFFFFKYEACVLFYILCMDAYMMTAFEGLCIK